MKRIFIVVIILGLVNVTAMCAQSKEQVKEQLKSEAAQIIQTLKLEQTKEKLVFNVLYHIKTRIDDLAFGTPNYDKLLGYINEERGEMMKVIMPTNKYKEYDKLYSSTEKVRLQKLKEQNEEYIKQSKIREEQERIESESLMQKERALAEAQR